MRNCAYMASLFEGAEAGLNGNALAMRDEIKTRTGDLIKEMIEK